MARKTKMKSYNSVTEVSNSTVNSSLGREDHVPTGVTRSSSSDCPKPPSIENRDVKCTNNAAERKGRKCETLNEKDEVQHTQTL